jgi:hypothetical protein
MMSTSFFLGRWKPTASGRRSTAASLRLDDE